MQVDWLTLSDYTGGTGSTTITGTVTDNLNIGVNRYATVRFTNEAGLYADLNITQTAFTEGLQFSVTPLLLQFETTGETLTGTVISNSKWFITEYPSWLTIVSDNPQMIGAGNLYFTAEPNTGTTERSGNIKIESYGEERLIFAIQPAYSTLRVTPKVINLQGETGATATTSVTVTSSANWSVSDYDSNYVWISNLSGTSGDMQVFITLQNVPDFILNAGASFQQTITFTDGVSTEIVTINLICGDNIDDAYVTVTYCLESGGMFLGYKFAVCQGCPEWSVSFQDDYTLEGWRERGVELIGSSCIEFEYVYFYTDRGGCHTVKFYSPYYTVPFAAFNNNPNVYSVVIGDRNEGDVNDLAFAGSSMQKLVLGMGTHLYNGGSIASNTYLGDYFYIPSKEHWIGDIGGTCGVLVTEQGYNNYDPAGPTNGIVCEKAVFIGEPQNGIDMIILGWVTGKTLVYTNENPSGRTFSSSLDMNPPEGIYTIYYPRNAAPWTEYAAENWYVHWFLTDPPDYRYRNKFNLIPYDTLDDIPL